MCSRMIDEVPLRAESLSTDFTFVRIITRVFHHVNFEVMLFD